MLLLLESRLQPESKQMGFASSERMYTKNNHKTLKMYVVASSFWFTSKAIRVVSENK